MTANKNWDMIARAVLNDVNARVSTKFKLVINIEIARIRVFSSQDIQIKVFILLLNVNMEKQEK